MPNGEPIFDPTPITIGIGGEGPIESPYKRLTPPRQIPVSTPPKSTTSSVYQRRLQEFIKLRSLIANQLQDLARSFLELQYQRRGVEQKQATAMAHRRLAELRKKFELQKRMGEKRLKWAEEDIPSWLEILGEGLMNFAGSYATKRGIESAQKDWLDWLRSLNVPEPAEMPSGPRDWYA